MNELLVGYARVSTEQQDQAAGANRSPGRSRLAHNVQYAIWVALRSAPSWPSQAGLKPEQAAKINMPVLLLTGEESTDPPKTKVDAVAAALPEAQRLVLARQQHIADILDPETFAKHLLGFLHGRILHCELDAIVEVEPLVTGA
jgi:pimeloyl-ACP methyl ester carboxylesterase